MSRSTISPCAELAHRFDRERFLCATFAPADVREALFALIAFNAEVARVRESVSEPTLGLIRLQFWRETIEAAAAGRPPAHPVAEGLAAAFAAHDLDRAGFETILEGREADLEEDPPADLAALEGYLAATSAGLHRLMLRVLGARGPEEEAAAHHGAIAYGMAGLVRAVPFHARQGRSYLPTDVVAQAGLDPVRPVSQQDVAPVVRPLVEAGQRHLDEARARRRRTGRRAQAALLPATIAGMHLKSLAGAGFDPFDPAVLRPAGTVPLRLLWAAATGRW